MGSLVGGIATAVFAILFSIRSSVLRKYRYAMGTPDLTVEDENNKEKNRIPNEELIRDFTDNKDENEFIHDMVRFYIKCIHENALVNERKAITGLKGQRLFFVSVIFAFG